MQQFYDHSHFFFLSKRRLAIDQSLPLPVASVFIKSYLFGFFYVFLSFQHKKNINFKDSEVISASEIGQFCYFSISWYLQQCGYKPDSPKLEIGIKKHENLGRIIESSKKSSRKSKVLALTGYLILIFGIFIIIYEVILQIYLSLGFFLLFYQYFLLQFQN